MSYVVAIPTYNRFEEVTKKTLNTLKEGGVNKNKIYLFVANKSQYDLYEQNVPKNLYKEIVIGKKGITNQRIFISQYFNEDQYVVSMDDDVEEFEILKGDKLVKLKDINAFFINAYKIMKKENMKFSKFFCRVELAIAISENVCNSLCKNLSYLEQMMIAFKEIFGNEINDYI